MQRRDFIKNVAKASAAVSAASVLPTTALSQSRVVGANDRIRVGLIGCGYRGMFVAKEVAKPRNVEFAAVCDLYPVHLDAAKEWTGGRAKAFKDFRKMLEMKDLDAVQITTPDHWHAIPAIMAAEAGKHMYLEKPIGHTIRENQAILKAVKKAGVITQVGTQHRSAPHWPIIRDLIADGHIGEVKYIKVWNNQNTYPLGLGKKEDSNPPEGVDWDFYLGPSPMVPYNENRFVGTYRWFLDYCNGIITDYGAHRLDSMHQVMGEDTPKSVSAVAHQHLMDDGTDVPDVLHVTYEYPSFICTYEALRINAFGPGGFTKGVQYYNSKGWNDRPNGLAFHGTKGTLFADRIGFEVFPEGDQTTRKYMNVGDSTPDHARDWVNSMVNGKQPKATIEMGHKGATACMLGNIAWQYGEKLEWDGEKEVITNHKKANKLLGRESRKPWDMI